VDSITSPAAPGRSNSRSKIRQWCWRKKDRRLIFPYTTIDYISGGGGYGFAQDCRTAARFLTPHNRDSNFFSFRLARSANLVPWALEPLDIFFAQSVEKGVNSCRGDSRQRLSELSGEENQGDWKEGRAFWKILRGYRGNYPPAGGDF